MLPYHPFPSSVSFPVCGKGKETKYLFSALFLSFSKDGVNQSQASHFLENPLLAVISVVMDKFKGMYGFSLSVKSTFSPGLTLG